MKVTGARLLLNALLQENVTTIFGYPGSAILPIYDELFAEPKLKHILIRHEQAAAFAANGYARSSGKVGVCLATSGPGATNLVTGIATAYLDSIPLIAITGQADLKQIGKDGFQWVSITHITLPITKNNYLIKNIDEIPATIAEAFTLARSGRPGPVLIDIPHDISSALTETNAENKNLAATKNLAIDYSQLPAIVNLIQQAQKPLLLIGGGVVLANASAELRSLVELTKIPVVTTLMGKSAFPNQHSYYLGWGGMNGSYLANYAMHQADLLIGIGLRFDDRFCDVAKDFSPGTKVIHIDIDAAEVNKIIKTDNVIVGDAKEVLAKLTESLLSYANSAIANWHTDLKNFSQNSSQKSNALSDNSLDPNYVMQALNQLLKGDEIIVTDVGQHQLLAAQFLDCKFSRQFLTSGGDGAMGFSLPAAIGASIANPDKQIICIVGDASIQMTIHELATIRNNQYPIKIFLFNNNSLGLVRQVQDIEYNGHHIAVDLADSNPDFAQLAAAYGIAYLSITEKDDVAAKLQQALQTTGAILVNIQINNMSNVTKFSIQKTLFKDL